MAGSHCDYELLTLIVTRNKTKTHYEVSINTACLWCSVLAVTCEKTSASPGGFTIAVNTSYENKNYSQADYSQTTAIDVHVLTYPYLKCMLLQFLQRPIIAYEVPRTS